MITLIERVPGEVDLLAVGPTELGARLHSLMAGVAAYDLPDQVRGLVGETVSTLDERLRLGAEPTARVKHQTHPLAAPAYGSGGRQQTVLTFDLRAAIAAPK